MTDTFHRSVFPPFCDDWFKVWIYVLRWFLVSVRLSAVSCRGPRNLTRRVVSDTIFIFNWLRWKVHKECSKEASYSQSPLTFKNTFENKEIQYVQGLFNFFFSTSLRSSRWGGQLLHICLLKHSLRRRHLKFSMSRYRVFLVFFF